MKLNWGPRKRALNVDLAMVGSSAGISCLAGQYYPTGDGLLGGFSPWLVDGEEREIQLPSL